MELHLLSPDLNISVYCTFFSATVMQSLHFLCLVRGEPPPLPLATIPDEKTLLLAGKPYMVNDRVNGMVNVMVNHPPETYMRHRLKLLV